MTKSYKVRGEQKEITDNGASQATKELAKGLSPKSKFSRGKLYFLEDELVFSQSLNESAIRNVINTYLSKGPVDLTTVGLYKPFKAPLEEANEGDSSWRVPYRDIEAVSLLKRAGGYEIFLRPSGDEDHLYRVRTQGGNDYIGLRWLYSPNHDTAVQMAGEIFDQINRYREIEVFNPGEHFVGQTKQVEFKKGVSKFADLDPVNQSRSPSSTSGSTDTATSDNTNTSEPNQISQNKSDSSDNENKTKEEDTTSGTPYADSNDEQSSQGGVTDVNNEAQHTKSDTKRESEKISDTQSVDSSSSKRRWTYLILGIVLAAIAPIVPTFADGILLGNPALILILYPSAILGLILIIFGIYRIIRY